MKRRIFIAISLSPELQEQVFKWREKFNILPVRWLDGKNLHLTLVPPWYEENIEEIIERLKTLAGVISSFSLKFSNVTYGPDPRRPRLIWAGGETPKPLLELVTALEKLLGNRAKQRTRPFRSHLTLARFRPETFSSFPIKQIEEEVQWKEKVHSFVLMESHLSRAGADYEILEEIALFVP